MIVIAWNNGAHARSGAGYGFRVHPDDRDALFQRAWTSILLEVDTEPDPVEVKLDAEKFWGDTNYELQCPAVGRWLRHNGLAPWARGNPPAFILEPVEGNTFRVVKGAKGPKSKI